MFPKLWCVVGTCFLVTLVAETPSRRHLVFLDPGHSSLKPGATSVSGDIEVNYNDALTEVVKSTLDKNPDLLVQVTRKRGEEIALVDRAERANKAKAELFISLHHDSANPKYLEKLTVNDKVAYRDLPSLRRKYQ